MAFDYAKTAGQILEMVGGKANVEGLTHCITRLRFMLKDMGLPKDSEVEKIPGVLRVIKQGGQYQVVIGMRSLMCLPSFKSWVISQTEGGRKTAVQRKTCFPGSALLWRAA